MKNYLVILGLIIASSLNASEVVVENITTNDEVTFNLKANVETAGNNVVNVKNLKLVSTDEKTEAVFIRLLGVADTFRNFNFVCKSLGFKSYILDSETTVNPRQQKFDGLMVFANVLDHKDGEVDIEDLSRYFLDIKTLDPWKTQVSAIKCRIH